MPTPNKQPKGPKLIDPSLYKQVGIDEKTGLPSRMVESVLMLKNMKHIMRLIDEQDAVNRYKWYNLPCNISSEELERLLYYKGQLCFFYFKELDEFYFMPFALDGSIDFYGRYNTIHPVPMSSGTEGTKEERENRKKIYETQRALLSMLKLNVVKAIKSLDELKEEDLYNSAVILWDHSRQIGQNIVPRADVNDTLLETIAEIPCFLRTALIASTGIKGMRVADGDAKAEVVQASNDVLKCALTGKLATPIISAIEIQELFEGPVGKAQEYLLAMQALENFRLSTYGLENGGLFEKKAHKLETEQQMNDSTVGLVYEDGLAIRQNFCNIVNSIWGTSIWCMPSESVTGSDVDGDGYMFDNNEAGENSGIESSKQEEGGEQ